MKILLEKISEIATLVVMHQSHPHNRHPFNIISNDQHQKSLNRLQN